MKTFITTFVSSAVTSFAFARVGDATWEHATWLALAMGCSMMTLHRFLAYVVEKTP